MVDGLVCDVGCSFVFCGIGVGGIESVCVCLIATLVIKESSLLYDFLCVSNKFVITRDSETIYGLFEVVVK